jgi:hypothetical protein
MRGHENSYLLDWTSNSGRKRTGFAQVVKKVPNTALVPCFVKNAEGM